MDEVDFSILQCISKAKSSLWKKKIYEQIKDNLEHYPLVKEVSLQTIGRRVENLEDDDLLTTNIISAKGLRRQYIIGFSLTEEGKNALAEKRRELLHSAIQYYLIDTGETLIRSKENLVELMQEELELPESAQDELSETFTEKELALLLVFYFFGTRVPQQSDEFLEKTREMFDKLPALDATFHDNLLHRLLEEGGAEGD